MPRKFRRFFVSLFLVLFSFIIIQAQSTGDVMRERITKAKAFIAVKNYNAAIYELETIKRETNDQTVHAVVNVLLMNSYLEQGDYKRAQDLLTELSKNNKAANYFTVAGQVIKGARLQLERYKSLGLSVSDRNLPLEAAADIEKMRQTLELVVEQSKVLGKDKAQTSNAMALLEEATGARSNLAKDDYDASRWKNEAADAREMLANSRSVVMNVDGTTDNINQNTVASNNTTSTTNTTNTAQTNSTTANTNPQTTNTNATLNPVSTQTSQTNNNQQTTNQTTTQNNQTTQNTNTAAVKETPKTSENQTTQTNNTNTETQSNNTNQTRNRRVENTNQQTTNQTTQTNQTQNTTKTDSNIPLEVGSLIDFAIQRVNPNYPQQARSIRQTGVVKVELVIDEEGKVVEVKKTSGPALLQAAAKDAAQKWRFKPFLRDGQPVKATGFINFNFSL